MFKLKRKQKYSIKQKVLLKSTMTSKLKNKWTKIPNMKMSIQMRTKMIIKTLNMINQFLKSSKITRILRKISVTTPKTKKKARHPMTNWCLNPHKIQTR